MTTDKQKLIQFLSGDLKTLKQQEIVSFIPEIKPMIAMQQHNPNHCYSVWEHTIHSIAFAPDNILLKLTMLFHDIGKPACYSQDKNGIGHFYGHPKKSKDIAFKILKRLQFEDSTIETVCQLIFYHDAEIPSKAVSVKRWLNKLGEEQFKLLLEVKKADIKAQSSTVQSQKLEKIKRLEQKLTEVIEKSKCFSKKDLAITGYDLIQADISQGKEIGKILTLLVDAVKQHYIKNEKYQLIQAAKEIYKNNA